MNIDYSKLLITSFNGAILFDEDYDHKRNYGKIANNINKYLNKMFSKDDFEIEIDEDLVINGTLESNDSKLKFSIDQDSVIYNIDQEIVSSLLTKKGNFWNFIEIVNNLAELGKSSFDIQMYGFNPTVLIPFIEDDKNIIILNELLNQSVFDDPIFTKPDNKYKFSVSYSSDIGNNTFLAINIGNKGKDILLSTDFRRDKVINKKYVPFIEECFSHEYLKWLAAFIQKITKDSAQIDYNTMIQSN